MEEKMMNEMETEVVGAYSKDGKCCNSTLLV